MKHFVFGRDENCIQKFWLGSQKEGTGLKYNWSYNIKVDLTEIACCGVNRIHYACVV